MRINSAARCSDGRRGHCGRQFSGSTYRLHPLMWGAKGGIGHLQVTVRALPIRCGCQAVEAGRGRDRVFPCRYAGRRQDGRCRDRRGRHRNGQVPTQVRAASRHSGSDSVRARFAAGRRFAMTRLLKKFSKCHLGRLVINVERVPEFSLPFEWRRRGHSARLHVRVEQGRRAGADHRAVMFPVTNVGSE